MNNQSTARRPRWVTVTLLGLSLVLIIVFVLLGNWQMRRLAWKQELIAAIDARAFGQPVGLPEHFDPDQHAYLRVSVDGRILNNITVLVKAVTEIGPGFWVMSPLETELGILWINRGYVPADTRDPKNWNSLETPVTGMLRPSVAGGTLLERNDPEIDRWVSRDTHAMSQTFNLSPTLPYFLDADHKGTGGSWPRGGLTIIKFNNSHLSYALTWYAMAILFVFALVHVIWRGRPGRQ